MAVCVVLPVVMSLLRVWSPVSVLFGAAAAFFLSRGLSILGREIADQRDRELYGPSASTGRTIYVTLINERGILLPRHERERRLEEARRRAGPRDTIVQITRLNQLQNRDA